VVLGPAVGVGAFAASVSCTSCSSSVVFAEFFPQADPTNRVTSTKGNSHTLACMMVPSSAAGENWTQLNVDRAVVCNRLRRQNLKIFESPRKAEGEHVADE